MSYDEVSKKLIKLGYYPVRQKGSHVIFKRKDGKIIVLPKHPGEKIGKGLLRKIISELKLSPKEFINL